MTSDRSARIIPPIIFIVATWLMAVSAVAAAESSAGRPAAAADRPLPRTGINVMPPTATSTNWVFGDLLLQAEYDGEVWRAFTGASEHEATYPTRGFIIDPAAAARVTDTGDGLIIQAPADARERGIHVYLPGASPEMLFHRAYLKRLKPFGILRFADWMKVEESGAPDFRSLAVSILLCNANDSSPWYSMGAQWSDDDVRRVAEMVKRGLDADMPIYIEWSTQPWKDAAGEDRDAFIDLWAAQARRDFEIWREVFTQEPQRVIRVASGPTDDDAMMAAMASKLGSDGFDAIACDARLTVTDQNEPVKRLRAAGSLDANALLDLLEQRAEDQRPKYQRYAALAKQHRVPLLAYAGGQDVAMGKGGSRDIGLAAQRHPRMYDLYLHHARQWFAAQRAAELPLDLIRRSVVVYASDVAPVDDAGAIGHLEYEDQPLAWAPKHRAIVDLAHDPKVAQRSSPQIPEGWTPAPPNSGWTRLIPSTDTRVIYVSSSDGDDRNTGVSPETAVRTVQRGYDLLRDGHPDWLLFKAGDTFQGGLGTWLKSGQSEDHPMVVSAYGPADASRPLFIDDSLINVYYRPSYGDRTVKHVAFVGLHARAARHGNRGTGIRWLMPSRDVLFEDVVIEDYEDGIICQSNKPNDERSIRDITFRRCIVRDCWSEDKGQGLYASGVDGLLIEQCLFDHNGWSSHAGIPRNKFSHNLYVSAGNDNVNVRNNILTRGGSHGLQLRCGGVVDGNLVALNPIAFYVSRTESIVRDNIVLFGQDMTIEDPRGWGIQVGTAAGLPSAIVENNIVAWNRGSQRRPGIEVNPATQQVTLIGNSVWQWYDSSGLAIEANEGQVAERRGNRTNGDAAPTIDEAEVEQWVLGLIPRERDRPRGVWHGWSDVLDRIRAGFQPRE